MGLSTFSWSDSSNDLGPIFKRFLSMESPVGACNSLTNHAGVTVYENACGCAKGPSHFYGYAGLEKLKEIEGCWRGAAGWWMERGVYRKRELLIPFCTGALDFIPELGHGVLVRAVDYFLKALDS